MVAIRKDMDVEGMNRRIHEKANGEEVNNDLGNHDFKIKTLDQNIMAIAGDMESFQLAVNKMNVSLLEL